MKKKIALITFFIIIIIIFCCVYSIVLSKRAIHFSIDDTIEIFKDLTENQQEYDTIFDNTTLKFFKDLNTKYNIKVSVYCFYQNEEFNLLQCTDKYKEEFEENSCWLKFGFHAYDGQTDYTQLSVDEAKKQYEESIDELKRIVGENSITRLVRLDRFRGNKEIIKIFTENEVGLKGLLGADTQDRPNYYLSNEQNSILFEIGQYYDEELNLKFYSTDIRLENVDNMNEVLKEKEKDSYLVIFTHEWLLQNDEIKGKIIDMCEFAQTNNIKFTI